MTYEHGVEKSEQIPDKPIVDLFSWSMRDGIIQGYVSVPEGWNYVTSSYVDWIKESDDTKIIETETAYYLLKGNS